MNRTREDERVVSMTVSTTEAIKKTLLKAMADDREKLAYVRDEMTRGRKTREEMQTLSQAADALRKNIADAEALYRQFSSELQTYKREQGIAACMICAKPHDRPGHSFCSVKCQGDFFNNKK